MVLLDGPIGSCRMVLLTNHVSHSTVGESVCSSSPLGGREFFPLSQLLAKGERLKNSWSFNLPLGGLVVLLAVNALLIKQNLELRRLAERKIQSAYIGAGEPVPAIQGIDSNGAFITMAYGRDSRPTLLFVSSV